MKVLVVLCAVAATCLAKPSGLIAPLGYSSLVSVSSVSHGLPLTYAARAPVLAAGPLPLTYAAAPAPIAYSAPAVVAAPAPAVVAAPAPIAYSAPAVVAAPAPAVVAAAPAVVAAPVAAAAKSQYHAQNELGEASYGHAEPGQTHNAVQDAHGNKIGSFSYVNPEGQVLRTDYVADAAGYRVASNALPAAPLAVPIDTPEVAAAKAVFLNEYAARAVGHRRRRSAVLVQTPASTAPLAPAVIPAPLAYSAPVVAAPAPLAYSAPVIAAPAPLAYSAPVVAAPAPLAYSAPAVVAAPAPTSRLATLTTVVNNPGHAVSYRVD